MAEEAGRIVKRKRIRLPQGNTVDIPVITEISFVDPVEQAQETRYSVDNTDASDRDVHNASIPGDGVATDESGQSPGLIVERVDVWKVIDQIQRAQETDVAFDSKTVAEPPEAPPYFTTHQTTHIVKYINTPDNGNWIKSELIDELRWLDPVEQAQETYITLLNPPDNDAIDGLTLGTDAGVTTVAIDPSIEEITDGNGESNPVRTDPFQNIVDFNEAGTGQPHSWVIGFINGAFLDVDGTARLFPREGDKVTFAYSFMDSYAGTAQLVTGTVHGMGGVQTVGAPLEYGGPSRESLVGTTFTATFVKSNSDPPEFKTMTWDISGMNFTPDHFQFSHVYITPHNPELNNAIPGWNVILTGSETTA